MRRSEGHIIFYIRAVAQGLARLVRDQEVGSSNLPSPINKSLHYNNLKKAPLSIGCFFYALLNVYSTVARTQQIGLSLMREERAWVSII